MINDPAEAAAELPIGPSISRASSLRFVADVAVSGLALLTGVVTARNLGPTGKGALSTLSYLVALAWLVAAMGSGEAGVSLIGSGRADTRRAIGSTVSLLIATSLVCGPAVYLVSAWPVLGLDGAHGGRLAAVLAVPAMTFAGVLPLFVEQRGRFGWSAAARVAGGATTLVATVVLVKGYSLSIFGGMLAVAAGPMVLAGVVVWSLLRDDVSLRPRWDGPYLRSVVRLGLPVQVGYLVAVGAARADVLVVAALRDATEVGLYSVALTLGQLTFLPAMAVSAASFARIAAASPADAAGLTRTTLRFGVLASLACAVGLAVVTPFVLPAVFGSGFRDSVGPGEVLLAANLATAVQWLGTRACAARGRTGVLARSYGATLVVMLGADLALVPTWGAMGAALGSLLASTVGAVVAMVATRRLGLLDQSPAR